MNRMTIHQLSQTVVFLSLVSLSGCVTTKEDCLQPAIAGFWGVYVSTWFIYQGIKKDKPRHYRKILAVVSILISVVGSILMPEGRIIYWKQYNASISVFLIQSIQTLADILFAGLLFGLLTAPLASALAKAPVPTRAEKDDFFRILGLIVFLYILFFVLPPWLLGN